MTPTRGHELLPASDVVPAEHAEHTLEPVPAAYFPAGQDAHDVTALAANVPRGQDVHPALVAEGTQYVPFWQQMRVPEVEHWPLGVGAVQPEVVQEAMLPV